jgi:hypothetical protein
LPKAEELIFRLRLKSAITVHIGKLLFEEFVIVTEWMCWINSNLVCPGERFVFEVRDDKKYASFFSTIGVGADRENEHALNHEILEF